MAKMCDFTTFKLQSFSFPIPVIHHIASNIPANGLKKLYKTCKYFNGKYQIWILDGLSIHPTFTPIKIKRYSLSIPTSDVGILGAKLWLTEWLFIDNTQFFTKIVKFDAFKLTFYCDLTIHEFQMVTESGDVECFELKGSIHLENGKKLAIEQILPFVPKAKGFILGPCFETEDTMEALLKLKRNVKLRTFMLRNLKLFFDIKMMAKFLEENLLNQGFCSFRFEMPEDTLQFCEELGEEMKTWNPKEKLPKNYPHLYK